MRSVFFVLLFLSANVFGQSKPKPVNKVPATKTSTATSGAPSSFERGRGIFNLYCLACHQKDGSGVGSLNPPYTKEWTGGDKKRLIKMLIKGSSGQVVIDGDRFSNTMPAQPQFTDQQLADVLTFVRKNFVNASVVTPAEVKVVRAGLTPKK
jgi:mono/diheme cytochrome c family protein